MSNWWPYGGIGIDTTGFPCPNWKPYLLNRTSRKSSDAVVGWALRNGFRPVARNSLRFAGKLVGSDGLLGGSSTNGTMLPPFPSSRRSHWWNSLVSRKRSAWQGFLASHESGENTQNLHAWAPATHCRRLPFLSSTSLPHSLNQPPFPLWRFLLCLRLWS